jgi:hypothetical protein
MSIKKERGLLASPGLGSKRSIAWRSVKQAGKNAPSFSPESLIC